VEALQVPGGMAGRVAKLAVVQHYRRYPLEYQFGPRESNIGANSRKERSKRTSAQNRFRSLSGKKKLGAEAVESWRKVSLRRPQKIQQPSNNIDIFGVNLCSPAQ
jgi:hypothetical protein